VKRNFLVVVASVSLREAIAGNLRQRGFTVTRAASGAEAERAVRSVKFDAVILESHLPDVPVDELKARLRRARKGCRVVTVAGFDLVRNSAEQMRFGADDYLVGSAQLLDMLCAPYAADGRGQDAALGHRGSEALIQVIDVLVGLLELDERFFGGSSHKAMRFAREAAEELGVESATRQEVVLAALLRDLGKVGVDPEIFTEPGAYDESQKEKMQGHVSASVRLFEHIDFPWKVLPVIRAHHERFDGTGYPDGLRGREIPMGARIVSVVDAFVALTSDRPHRAALGSEEALDTLVRQAGRQFDPEVVEAFQKVLDKRLSERRTDRKPRVLLADANGDFRRLLKMRLLNEGFDVVETDSTGKALGLLVQDPPDLALIDLDDDSVEAFQLLEELRGDEGLSRIPLALLSSTSDRVLRIRALRQGVDEFLAKDGDLEELMARIENVLTREAIRRHGGARRPRRGITGNLENLALPDIVQTLVMGMKSACVTLTCNGRTGKIWFDNGQARHAKVGRKQGESAFFEMVGWSDGEFVIEHGVTTDRTTLERDAMFLLMEGLRLIDEGSEAADKAAS
jgi:response regulator RpfG family c-di-GMP phosphodiesterase